MTERPTDPPARPWCSGTGTHPHGIDGTPADCTACAGTGQAPPDTLDDVAAALERDARDYR